MPELNAIYDRLGALDVRAELMAKEQDHARERDEKIFAKLEELATKQASGTAFESRLKVVEAHTEDWINVRRYGVAIWAVSLGAAAFLGHAVEYIKGLLKS